MKGLRHPAVLIVSFTVVLALMLPGVLPSTVSLCAPLLQGTLTPAAFAYLPYVARQYPPQTATPGVTPTNTPTPTSTPVAGCSTTPALIAPADGSTLNTLIPLLQWDSGNNPNATEFYLDVWLDPGLTEYVTGLRCTGCGIRGEYQWRIHRYLVGNLDPATTHYWRAYLMCGDTRGPYSDVWSFTTGSGGTILPGPNLISPADGTTLPGTTVSLQWSSVNAAVEYWVSAETQDRDYVRDVPGTVTTLRELQPNASFEWWVQARNDYAWGADSTHWHFTTGANGSSISPNSSSSLLPDRRDHVAKESNGTTTFFEEQRTR
jgi:hypothetical protein